MAEHIIELRRSSPVTARPRYDLRKYAYEICNWNTELWRDELAATLLAAAAMLERANMKTDTPYAFWLGKESADG